MGAHAHPVPEDRAARERARRVHREHRHGLAAAAQLADVRPDERRLAHAGGAGEADHASAPEARGESGRDHRRILTPALHPRDQPGEGGRLAIDEPADQRLELAQAAISGSPKPSSSRRQATISPWVTPARAASTTAANRLSSSERAASARIETARRVPAWLRPAL